MLDNLFRIFTGSLCTIQTLDTKNTFRFTTKKQDSLLTFCFKSGITIRIQEFDDQSFLGVLERTSIVLVSTGEVRPLLTHVHHNDLVSILGN